MMKQSLKWLCLAALALSPVLASAQKKGKARKSIPATKLVPATSAVRIFGTLPTDEYDGQQAYLLRQGLEGVDTLASVPIRGNKFVVKEGLKVDTLQTAIARVGKQGVELILEPGDILVSFEDRSAKGTRLNDTYVALRDKVNEDLKPLGERLTQAKTAEERQPLIEEYRKYMRAHLEERFKAHRHNAIGALALSYFLKGRLDLSNEEVRAYINAAPPALLAVPSVAKSVKAFEALEATSAGKPYVDVEGINDAKEPSRLKDFVSKGHYTLVDFWASWCGPCRRAMPALKKIYETYRQDGLQIVGLAVWDKWDDHLKAVKDLDLPWPQIFNEQGTEPYGIKGIPQIMLIAPDGTIVARDLHGEEGIVKVLEAEKSKNGGKL